MRLAVITILTLLSMGSVARADAVNDRLTAQVSQYLVANPTAIKQVQTPADVVRTWRDMVMVGDMIQLAADNALPAPLKPQIAGRLDAANISMRIAAGQEDRQIALLSDIALLFAKTALDFTKGKVPYTTFGDARALLTGGGAKALARDLEGKYSKPGAIIPPDPVIEKW
ncbi:hypothetical protein H261_11999 [Paramagnetospirillum caucaseum]|uniref:Uncharacterized protein n=1 Tax=Paramagnetospirillum caucaseum TaxID=1244869 RepID=M2Y9Q4_9PROT|nr:hypothetical protein [Paramagnetospirillum caucaseum]EME69756.1 hypothetical protein H261_11999 [Paramagnetospirillum caucaseum]